MKEDTYKGILAAVEHYLSIETGTEYTDHSLGEEPFTYKITDQWKVRRIISVVELARTTCKTIPGNPRVLHAWNKVDDGWQCMWCEMTAVSKSARTHVDTKCVECGEYLPHYKGGYVCPECREKNAAQPPRGGVE